MAQRLLDGLRVVDLGGDPSARAARVLGDLGADVVRVVPPAGDPLGGNVARAWNVGKQVVRLATDDPALDDLLAVRRRRVRRARRARHASARSRSRAAGGLGADLARSAPKARVLRGSRPTSA